MITNETALAVINSPVRSVKARVECYEASALVHTFTESDRLISIEVERLGEGKFFGFTMAQKANVKLIDTERELSISTANTFKIYFNEVNCLSAATVTEVRRDENDNSLSITAYDFMNKATSLKVNELSVFGSGYTVLEFAQSCASLMGLDGVSVENVTDDCFSLSYESGANFDGGETVRSALTSIAEATQTICFINHENKLVFKRLDRDGEPKLVIDKSRYSTLSSKTNRRLSTIYSCTSLGDDLYASTTESGSTAYVRDNPFWDLREDRVTLVDNALAAVGGLTINQFDLEWWGNFLVEIGDKLGLITKDENTVYSYLLNDTIKYDGVYRQETHWEYEDNSTETSDNPTSIGDVIRKTRAEVDKVNQQITLVAEKTEENSSQIAEIKITTEGITDTVKKEVQESISEQVQIEVEKLDLVGIASSEVTYQESASGTQVPTGEWLLDIPEVQSGNYLWTRTKTIYTNDDESVAYSVSKSGVDGVVGEDGVSVDSIKSFYILAEEVPEKPTANPPDGWSETEPSVELGADYSMYRVELTEFDDGTWAYGEVTLSSSFDGTKAVYEITQTNATQISELIHTSDGFTMNFQTINESITELNNVVSTDREEQLKYIKFIDGEIIIGVDPEDGEDEFKLKMSNQRISFLMNGSEVAYFADDALNVETANLYRAYITKGLYIGGLLIEQGSDGNVNARWIG